MIRVFKSQVGDEGAFVAAVEAYRQAMLAHRFTVNEAAPTARAPIESCIRRVQVPDQADEFVADYEFVDDTPPPPTVAELRQALIQKSRMQEMEETNGLMSAGARRLFELELAEASSKKADQRTTEDDALFERQKQHQASIRKIQMAGAKREVAIEAMTDDQVRSQKP